MVIQGNAPVYMVRGIVATEEVATNIFKVFEGCKTFKSNGPLNKTARAQVLRSYKKPTKTGNQKKGRLDDRYRLWFQDHPEG